METTIRLSALQKTLVFWGVMGSLLWLGGSVVRSAIAFDLFIPGTLTWKTPLPEAAVMQTIRLYSITAFYTLTGYGVALVFLLSQFFLLKKEWRGNGWLLMSGLLFLLYIPVECAEAWYDIQLIQMTNAGLGFGVEAAKELLLKRLTVWQGAPVLAFLGYSTAIGFMIWKPFQKKIG